MLQKTKRMTVSLQFRMVDAVHHFNFIMQIMKQEYIKDRHRIQVIVNLQANSIKQLDNFQNVLTDSLSNIKKNNQISSIAIANSRFQRVGSIVICTSVAYHTVNEIKSIPYGYRPIHSLYIPIFINHSSRITLLLIKDDGSLNVWESGVMNGNTLFCQDGAQITVDNYPS